MKSLSPFKGGEVGTKVIPCSQRWCICKSLLEELVNPAKCLGPLSSFAPPSDVDGGVDAFAGIAGMKPIEDVPEGIMASAPAEKKDSDELAVLARATEDKVRAEEEALEAARALELEKKRAEQEAHDAVMLRLEGEAAARRDLEAEEMRYIQEKERRDQIRVEEEELRLLQELQRLEAEAKSTQVAFEVSQEVPSKEEAMATPMVVDASLPPAAESGPENRIETLKKIQQEREATGSARLKEIAKLKDLFEAEEAAYKCEGEMLDAEKVELQGLEEKEAEMRRLEEEKAEALRKETESKSFLVAVALLTWIKLP